MRHQLTAAICVLLILPFIRLHAAEQRDLLDNPVTVAAPVVPQVVVAKDVKDLPAEAVRAVEAFNAAEAKARAAYDKAVEAERAKLLKSLETAKANATKAGNLEGAMAVKSVSEKLTVVEKRPDMAVMAADVGVDALVNGKWVYSFVRPDGTTGSAPVSFDREGKFIGGRGWKEDSYKIVGTKLIVYTADKSVWAIFIKTETGWDQDPKTTSGNGNVHKLTLQP